MGLEAVRAWENYQLMMRDPERGPHIRDVLMQWGYDPDRIVQLSSNRKRELVRKLRAYDRELMRYQREMKRDLHKTLSLMDQARKSSLEDAHGHDMTDEEFAEMRERELLHVDLRTWSRGPLILERPQGSSLHLLAQYDLEHCGESIQKLKKMGGMLHDEDLQSIVVENDWGAAVPPMDGEWRLPFRLTCWEFRLSGVRTLAMVDATDPEKQIMFMIYGRDSRWVIDDYNYRIGQSGIVGAAHRPDSNNYEFRRVARRVHDCIRASCIMLDAQVANCELTVASNKLRKKRLLARKTPPRDHYVVNLIRQSRRYVPQTATPSGLPRAPQRGHWRKGTWVHFDDQDSGQVQYVNDGGFVVSKTWRRWHFAGDPRNILHKEYKV